MKIHQADILQSVVRSLPRTVVPKLVITSNTNWKIYCQGPVEWVKVYVPYERLDLVSVTINNGCPSTLPTAIARNLKWVWLHDIHFLNKSLREATQDTICIFNLSHTPKLKATIALPTVNKLCEYIIKLTPSDVTTFSLTNIAKWYNAKYGLKQAITIQLAESWERYAVIQASAVRKYVRDTSNKIFTISGRTYNNKTCILTETDCCYPAYIATEANTRLIDIQSTSGSPRRIPPFGLELLKGDPNGK
jgi:hypothetical protein